jgi:hypothetical protein
MEKLVRHACTITIYDKPEHLESSRPRRCRPFKERTMERVLVVATYALALTGIALCPARRRPLSRG